MANIPTANRHFKSSYQLRTPKRQDTHFYLYIYACELVGKIMTPAAFQVIISITVRHIQQQAPAKCTRYVVCRVLLGQKCRDSAVSNKDLYPTFVRTIPSTFKVSKSVISLLKRFSWTRFTAIVGNRWLLPPSRRSCICFGFFVCWFVCQSAALLKKLWKNYYKNDWKE